ncbi:MAG: Brp/Blh family beta-carotene 15,15'-dioxygenase [Pseudomonadota bacterium]
MSFVMKAWLNVFVSISVVFILVEWIVGFEALGVGVTVGIAAAFVLSGLPHGAMDLWISRRAGYWTSWRTFAAFHALYIACAALCFLLFSVWGSLALLAFLAFSIVHFSDDWSDTIPRPVRLLLSISTITLPFLAHPQDVADIFSVMLGQEDGRTEADLEALSQYLPTVIMASLGAVAVIDWRALALPATVFAGALFLPPLIFFGLYFAVWHSPLHLKRHADLIASPSRLSVLIAYAFIAACFAAAVTAVTLPAIVSLSVSDHIIRMIFWGLAALTVPHMILLAKTGVPMKSL